MAVRTVTARSERAEVITNSVGEFSHGAIRQLGSTLVSFTLVFAFRQNRFREAD